MIISYKEITKGAIVFILFGIILFLSSFLFKESPQAWFYFSNIIKLAGFVVLLILLVKNPKNQFIVGMFFGLIIFFIIPALVVVLQVILFGNLM